MVNIGVIGCGYWGPNLVRNFQEIEESRVVAVCDLEWDRLRYIKGRYPTIDVTTRYGDILKDKRINAVAVATPVATHFALGKEVLQHNKHLLMEKPMARTQEEAEILNDLSRKKRRVLMVDHTFIYSGAVKKMKEVIQDGQLGEVYYFDSVRVNLGLFQHDVNVVWDLATHDISIMDYLLDERPTSVSARGACHLSSSLEDIAYLTLGFGSGLIGHFHVNWLAPVKVRMILIGGSRKMVVYNDMEPLEKVRVYDKGVVVRRDKKSIYRTKVDYRSGDMFAPHLDPSEALKLECVDFVKCIEAKRKPIYNDGYAGSRVVRILEVAQKSMENQGREIML